MDKRISEPSEFQIETVILEWLNMQRGIFAFKVETGGFYNVKKRRFQKRKSKFVLVGTADIIGTLNGRFFALEVKSRTGRVSLDQLAFLKCVQDAGGIAGVVRSLEDVIRLIGPFISLGQSPR